MISALAITYNEESNIESSYIIKVLEKLSELYLLPQEKIAEITTQNSKDVFNI
jgi:TatD DNase family protein